MKKYKLLKDLLLYPSGIEILKSTDIYLYQSRNHLYNVYDLKKEYIGWVLASDDSIFKRYFEDVEEIVEFNVNIKLTKSELEGLKQYICTGTINSDHYIKLKRLGLLESRNALMYSLTNLGKQVYRQYAAQSN